MFKVFFTALLTTFAFLSPVAAGESDFHPGPVIPAFGKIATIDSDMPIPEGTVMKVVIDVSKQAEVGSLNRNMERAARFLNMHVEAGMPVENIELALVVHGGASNDVMSAAEYKKRLGGENGSAALIKALVDHGVEVIICGQSATYHGIGKQDLLPGVKMSLSAMTAHALLQQQGYTLNPF